MIEKIIDFHAHIYPEKIAEKATKTIGAFYDAPMAYTGLTQELLESGRKIGVEKYIVHSTATKPEQVESINNFVISEITKKSSFIGFGTIHPDYENPQKELERIKKAGLKGIKLHPDFQKFAINTSKMDPIYEILSELQMPVLVHAGDKRFAFSNPKLIAHVLDKHPQLLFVGAHFGGYTEWDDAMNYLVGRKIWFDTSSTLWKLPVDFANTMIEKHGCEYFLFGSDFPMWDHSDELQRFNKLALSQEQRRKILYENAVKLLNL